MKNIVLLLASGKGSRCGLDIPKQFAKIDNKTILEYSIEVFETHPLIDEIIIVTNEEYVEQVKTLSSKYSKINSVIKGGKERKDSSYNGITSIHEDEANILIHDAVRPLVSKEIISNCISSLEEYSAVCVTVPSVDTIFVVDEKENITNIPQRNCLKRAQTPQCFKLSVIKEAHKKALKDSNCRVTDDCGLIMNYTDKNIHTITGSTENIKVTYKEDIDFVKSHLKQTV